MLVLGRACLGMGKVLSYCNKRQPVASFRLLYKHPVISKGSQVSNSKNVL